MNTHGIDLIVGALGTSPLFLAVVLLGSVIGVGVVISIVVVLTRSRRSHGASTSQPLPPRQSPPSQVPPLPSELLHKELSCARCHAAYQEGDAFCKKCGLALAVPQIQTELARPTTTCPRCSALVPFDVTFCPKCGFTVSLKGTSEPTVFVDTPLPPTLLKNSAPVNTQAETVAATTTTRSCPSCHMTVRLGPDEKFCGNCGQPLEPTVISTSPEYAQVPQPPSQYASFAPPLIQPSTRTVGGTILSLLFYLWGIFWLSLGLAAAGIGIFYTGTDPVVFVASFIVGIVILIFLLRFRKRLYLGTWRRLWLEIGLLLIGVLVTFFRLYISEGGVIVIYGLIAAFVAYW